jgi:mannose-6-phosphate isomerase-like protein (cupin superfamily)
MLDEQGNCIKNIMIRGGEKISLQSHQNRLEEWHVMYGECEITINKMFYRALPFTVWIINSGDIHRIEAVTDTVVREISSGYQENDIIRYKDDYGRAA